MENLISAGGGRSEGFPNPVSLRNSLRHSGMFLDSKSPELLPDR